nr:hypothetical protein [Tanacetum cinerariifolium]
VLVSTAKLNEAVRLAVSVEAYRQFVLIQVVLDDDAVGIY